MAAKMAHCNKSALEQKQIKPAEKLQFFVIFFTLRAGVCRIDKIQKFTTNTCPTKLHQQGLQHAPTGSRITAGRS